MKLLTSVTVPLSVPVPVKDASGKDATRDSFTLKRPKLRHAKAIAALIGPQLVSALMDSGDGEIDKEALAKEAASAVMKPEVFDELTSVIADMCGEDQAFIDDIDWIDLPAIGKAFLDFFPALRSTVLLN